MVWDTFDVVMIDIRFVHLHAGGWGLNLSVSHALSAYLFLRVRQQPVCGLFSGFGQSLIATMRVFDGSKASGVGCGALRDRQEIAVSRY